MPGTSEQSPRGVVAEVFSSDSSFKHVDIVECRICPFVPANPALKAHGIDTGLGTLSERRMEANDALQMIETHLRDIHVQRFSGIPLTAKDLTLVPQPNQRALRHVFKHGGYVRVSDAMAKRSDEVYEDWLKRKRESEPIFVCTKCTYVGPTGHVDRGNDFVGCLMNVLIVPGIFYTLWRTRDGELRCPNCKRLSLELAASDEGIARRAVIEGSSQERPRKKWKSPQKK